MSGFLCLAFVKQRTYRSPASDKDRDSPSVVFVLQTTLLAVLQTTLNPLLELVPQTTDVPQTTELPATFVPQTTDVPQTTELPATCELPLDRVTVLVLEL